MRWRAACPVCRGTGEIDGKPRRGVSVFPTVEGLYRYMLANGTKFEDCIVVELEGNVSPDVDFDSDQGAILVIPNQICSCRAADRTYAERLPLSGR